MDSTFEAASIWFKKEGNMEIVNLKERQEFVREIAEWLYNQWGHLTQGSSLEKTVNKIRERCDSDGIPVTFVAVKDEQAAGTVSIVPCDMKIRKELTPWIASVFVKEEERNQGIGSQLMRFIEDECKQRGFSKIYLFTPNKQRMYSRLGWKIRENLAYRGEQVSVMEKCI